MTGMHAGIEREVAAEDEEKRALMMSIIADKRAQDTGAACGAHDEILKNDDRPGAYLVPGD
jgi:hypothetical protein